jgi:hypothetical protein
MKRGLIIGIVVIVLVIIAVILVFNVFHLDKPKEFRECIKKDDYKCMHNVSLKHQSIKLCKYIGSDSDRLDCIQSIIKDPDYCKNLEYSEISYCYIYSAKYLEDESICERIQNNNQKPYCFQLVGIEKQDKTICYMIHEDSMLERDAKENCLLNVAIEEKDIDICYEFKEKNYNRDRCFFVMARHFKNESLCLEINIPNQEELCIKNMSPE